MWVQRNGDVYTQYNRQLEYTLRPWNAMSAFTIFAIALNVLTFALLAGNNFVFTNSRNFRNGAGQLVPYHSDGLRPYDTTTNGFPVINDGQETCNAYYFDCNQANININDVNCNANHQFVCEGRCYPDGKFYCYL